MPDSPPLHVEVDDLVIVDDREAERYEARPRDAAPDAEPSIAAYWRNGDVITFTHTEVPRALEGRGVASRLVRAALDDVRARGLRAAPMCPYVTSWLRRHHEYLDIVEPSYHERLRTPPRDDD